MKKVAFEMAALGRQGDVKELKGAYLYLASNASTFTTGIGEFPHPPLVVLPRARCRY